MTKKTRGDLIVLSGPSGVGKSTVIAELLHERRDIYFSVSFTTRPKRVGEAEGVSYHFITREEFERMIAAGDLLEYTEYVGNYYGTSLKVIEDKLADGIDVLLDIEVQGAAKVRQTCPHAIFIFIIPPSREELSRRLHGRNTDNEDAVENRLRKAEDEYKHVVHYDYLVLNGNVSDAAAEVRAILTAEACRTEKRLHFIQGSVESAGKNAP